jgi:hypothetical protein
MLRKGRNVLNEDSKERRVWALFRFGQGNHLEQLRKDGVVYMNSQCYFAKLEADLLRGDRFEGTDRIIQPKALKRLIIESNVDSRKFIIPASQLRGPLGLSLGKSSCNIYCTFAVTETASFSVDETNFGFGDSFVIVLDIQTFVDRLRAAAKAVDLDLYYGFVEYYDPNVFSGETGPFKKPATFAYQKEFRFVVQPGSRDAIVLRLGSLRDITSDIFPLSEINRLVEFHSGPGVDSDKHDDD